MAGMPGVGALVNTSISVINGASFQSILQGVAVSAFSSGITGPLSGMIGTSLGLSARHFSMALTRGVLGGSVSGGLHSLVNGGKFGDGFKRGALIGGLTSSFVWAARDYQSDQFIEKNINCGGLDCKPEVINAIKDAGQSPVGQRLMNRYRDSGAKLMIFPEELSDGKGPSAYSDADVIYFGGDISKSKVDGKKLTTLMAGEPWGPTTTNASTFIHELAHTPTGGGYLDPGPKHSGPDVISEVENKYRSWMGTPSRDNYSFLARGAPSLPVYQPNFVNSILNKWR